jgi:hypothetical protein
MKDRTWYIDKDDFGFWLWHRHTGHNDEHRAPVINRRVRLGQSVATGWECNKCTAKAPKDMMIALKLVLLEEWPFQDWAI